MIISLARAIVLSSSASEPLGSTGRYGALPGTKPSRVNMKLNPVMLFKLEGSNLVELITIAASFSLTAF